MKTILSETIVKQSTPVEESQGKAQEESENFLKVKQENIGMPNIPTSTGSNQNQRKKGFGNKLINTKQRFKEKTGTK